MSALWDTLTRPRPGGGLSPAAWATLAALALALLTPGLGALPVWDRDEARYAQASKQMLETGDVIDIRFQDQTRYVKPVGIYWMQAASASVFGGAEAPIAAYRLPSLLGIVVAVAATAWLGARLGGPGVGVMAGLLLALAVVPAVEARTAKTDAALAGAAAVAQAALFVLAVRMGGHNGGARVERPAFWGAPAAFWTASAAAMLIKGPIVTLVSALTLGGYCLWRRDLAPLRRLRVGWGVLVMAAIVLPWVAAITFQTRGAFLMDSLGHALLGKVAEGDDSHGGPPGYHTVAALLTLWPATALFALAALAAWRGRRDPAIQFLIVWILPTWIVFEAVATKLMHYVLPVFPAIMILAALGARDAGDLLTSRGAKIAHGVFVALFAVMAVVLGLAAAVWQQTYEDRIAVASAVAIGFGVLAAAAGVRFARRPTGPRLLGLTAATFALYVAGFQVAIPRVDSFWPSDRVAQRLQELTGCDALAVATAGYREPSNVFLFGTDTVLRDGGDAARHLLAHPQCGVAVVDRRQREAFDAVLATTGAQTRSVGVVEGVNTVKGRELELDILVLSISPLRPAAAAGE